MEIFSKFDLILVIIVFVNLLCFLKGQRYKSDKSDNDKNLKIKTEILEKWKKDKNHLSEYIGYCIGHRYYTDADILIGKIGINSLQTKMILRNFYFKNNNNFTLLRDYAINSGKYEIILNILDQLWLLIGYENDNDRDFSEYLEIYNLFKIKVLNVENLNEIYHDYVENLLNLTIEPKIITKSIHILKESILYKNNNNFQRTSMILFINNFPYFNEIIREVIEKTYQKISLRELILIMWNQLHWTIQKAIALKYIFWNLELANMYNNGESVMLIAQYLMYLKKTSDYIRLPNEQRIDIEICINNLPKLIKYLYFSNNSEIYLKNFVSQKNLGIGYVYDKWKHNTQEIPKYLNEIETAWIAKPVGEFLFKFKNQYNNEYLFVGETKHINGYWRKVFTWKAKDDYNGSYQNNIIWKVQFENNFLLISNILYDERLCSSFGHVLTTKFMKQTQCNWIVEVCAS